MVDGAVAVSFWFFSVSYFNFSYFLFKSTPLSWKVKCKDTCRNVSGEHFLGTNIRCRGFEVGLNGEQVGKQTHIKHDSVKSGQQDSDSLRIIRIRELCKFIVYCIINFY